MSAWPNEDDLRKEVEYLDATEIRESIEELVEKGLVEEFTDSEGVTRFRTTEEGRTDPEVRKQLSEEFARQTYEELREQRGVERLVPGSYGTNEGDRWSSEGSTIQERIDRDDPGNKLIHQIDMRENGLEEVLYVTEDVEIIESAFRGDILFGTMLCPRCLRNRYTLHGGPRTPDREFPPPALSRTDNETRICSPCGDEEAMRDLGGLPMIPPDEWPIVTHPAFGVGRRYLDEGIV